jgi:hypothetical protein
MLSVVFGSRTSQNELSRLSQLTVIRVRSSSRPSMKLQAEVVVASCFLKAHGAAMARSCYDPE